ncbi:MAG: tRNA (guanine(6)-N2)-methyltransferase [Candidatus Nezhaarchaeota archaeon]|nr:tRNA (guanine(6)-N2)-methyltransferase [Candidatus Nezhaarchaeota archaeon]
MLKFMATTIGGMEDIAAEEVRELGGSSIEVGSERLFFDGDEDLIYRINIESRCLHKLIIVLNRGKALSLRDIYSAAKSIEYEEYMGLDQTFAVRTTRVGVHDYTSIDVSATVGQAIIDHFMEVKRARPKVNLKDPDVEVSIYVKDDDVTIGINTSGESLHRRNYRVYDHPAAVKTTIASCMLRTAKWQGEGLLDPMCGGGTIVVEAALMARRFPPGFFRRRFAFTRLLIYDPRKHRSELERSLNEVDRKKLVIWGFDISPKHVRGAMLNASSAGVDDTISFSIRDATKEEAYKGVNAKLIVVNPPYGIRQLRPKALMEFYVKFLRTISNCLSGSNLTLITGAPKVFEEASAKIGCKVLEVRRVKHGELPAKVYSIAL